MKNILTVFSLLTYATNLNDIFMKNSLNLDVKFRELESQFQRELQQQSYKEIEILEIES